MTNIDEFNLERLLPESLRQIPDIKALAQAVSTVLQKKIKSDKEIINSKYKDIGVDLIAWEKHVDFYDASLSLEQKKQMIDGADEWHKHKGTPWAVEQVTSVVFQNAKMTEWFEYGGSPYRFQIETTQPLESEVQLQTLYRLIDSVKRKSTRLENVTFKKEIQNSQFYGGVIAISDLTVITPARFEMENIYMDTYRGGIVNEYKIERM